MPKTCNKEGCTSNIFGGGYCKSHQYLRTDKKQKPIKPFSAKRVLVNKLYAAKAALFLATHKKCEINSPDCPHNQPGKNLYNIFPVHIHHVRGRGDNLMNQEYWMAACDPCNVYIEDHHAWAVENGFKVSRHAITQAE